MTDQDPDGVDVQWSEWVALRKKALEALESGRYSEAQDLFMQGGETVDELTHELLVRHAELEFQAEELRDATEANRRARDRFERFFEELPQPALTIDAQSGRITRLNRMAERLFPEEHEEGAERFLLRRFGNSQSDCDLLAGGLAEVVRSGHAVIREVKLRSRNDRRIDVKIHFDSVADDATDKQIILAVVIDETPLKRRIAEVEKGHRELRCIADVLELGAVVHATDEDILRQVPDLVASAVELPVRILYDDQVYQSHSWQVSAVTHRESIGLQGRRIGVMEFGKERGAVPGGSPSSETVTDLGEFPRTVCMQVGKLMEGRSLSRRLNEAERVSAIGGVAGGVAHEFNNLLTVIMGNAENIADDAEAVKLHKDAAETVLSASETAAMLVRKLLTYARKQDLSPETVDLSAALHATLPLLRATLRPDVSLEADLEKPSPPLVSLDTGKFETAILALVDNAQEAMAEGGMIKLSLNAIHYTPDNHVKPGAQSFVEVSVTDTGSGMDEAVRRRATEPFFTTKNRADASGLGLSVVAGFISQSDAELRISSEPGKGTTVSMIFPAEVGTSWEDHHDCS